MMHRGQTNPWQISTKRPNPWDRHSWKKRLGEKTNKLKHLFKTSKIATLTTLFLSWLACDKSKLCAFSLSLLHSIHNPITYMMLVGIRETLLLFPRQVHESILGFLEIQDPGFFLDHEDPKIPTM
jgi:hypothetical protein